METTGLRNRIHISETTAHELTKFRKENWICPRKDSVQVKGKGQMMTYWVNPIEAGSSCLDGSMTSTSQTKIDGMLATTLDRTERLINWNTDVLAKLLSTLVARSSSQKYVDSGDLWKSQVSEMLKSNTLVLDEVKDVIDYPEIYHSNTCEDPDAIRLDSLVLSQLREFVESIAEMYRSVSNPFHNFEQYVVCSFVQLA